MNNTLAALKNLEKAAAMAHLPAAAHAQLQQDAACLRAALEARHAEAAEALEKDN